MDGDCSHEINRHLLLGRKAVTTLDSIFKSRDITLLIKVHRVKALVFPVVMYRCESWKVKKVECQRIHAFELCCWQILLRGPWTVRRSCQSVLMDNTEYSIGETDAEPEALMLWPPDVKTQLTGIDSDAGKD